MVQIISITLDEAIAFYETYVPTGQDATLIGRVNKSDFHPAFNIISDALHRETILALCRIWDKDKDTANLNRLAADFRDKKVLAGLKSAKHEVDPDAMKKWLAAVVAGYKSEELEALRRARHRAIARLAGVFRQCSPVRQPIELHGHFGRFLIKTFSRSHIELS
jgi:hypothetical protein